MRLVWSPWKFLVEFFDNFRQRRDVLTEDVAMLFQVCAYNLLVELEAGRVIGFIKVEAHT